MLVTNYGEYLDATASCKGVVWSLYLLDTLTLGYYYIGISSCIERRAYQHVQANDVECFTAVYGTRAVTVLAVFGSREDAERAEWALWKRLHARDGKRVGGCELSGMGWA
jgi:predicted GIY-YIG superfamily endonuclease